MGERTWFHPHGWPADDTAMAVGSTAYLIHKSRGSAGPENKGRWGLVWVHVDPYQAPELWFTHNKHHLVGFFPSKADAKRTANSLAKRGKTSRTLARALDNPISFPAIGEGALIVGGAALAGLGWWWGNNATTSVATCIANIPTNANAPAAATQCQADGARGQTIGTIGIVAGLAASGGGLGGLAAGKVGGVVGALALPAAYLAYSAYNNQK